MEKKPTQIEEHKLTWNEVITNIDLTETPNQRGYRLAHENTIPMYQLLKEIEANSTRCPICHNRKENGHDYNCKLAQVLAKIEGRE